MWAELCILIELRSFSEDATPSELCEIGRLTQGSAWSATLG